MEIAKRRRKGKTIAKRTARMSVRRIAKKIERRNEKQRKLRSPRSNLRV